jgi:hypothetical protein
MTTKPNQYPTNPQAQKPTTTTTAVLVQEKSVDCKTTTTVAGQNSINSQKPTQPTSPTQKPDPRKIGNLTDNMAVPTTYTPTTTQVQDCVTTAAVVPTTAPATTSTSASTAGPTTLAPTTTASAKTNIAPVVTSAPTTAAQRPVCDAVRKKRRLC